MIRTHEIAGVEVTLEAGHRAWAAYERQTGRSILEATEFGRLMRASVGVSMVYELGYAMARKWMDSPAGQAVGVWSYETWLDVLPEIGSDSWNELHTKVSDLVCQAFYGKSWAQMLAALDAMAEVIRATEAA